MGISPDPVGKLASVRRHGRPDFPLLSDPDHAVAEAYAAWGEKKNYGKTYQGLIRSTVVVDPEGRSRSRSTTSVPPGMSPNSAGT